MKFFNQSTLFIEFIFPAKFDNFYIVYNIFPIKGKTFKLTKTFYQKTFIGYSVYFVYLEHVVIH